MSIAAAGQPFRVLAFGSVLDCSWDFPSRVQAHIVFQATPRDPLLLTGAVLAMGLLGSVAT